MNKNLLTLVYISILNWNKAEATLVCLDHLLQSDIPPNLKIKVFIVDNGSDQDDWRCLSEGVKNDLVTLIHLDENLGFAGGHNIIMRQAIDDQADYVWLVNNDGIPFPETLSRIIALAERDPSCGAVSPLLVDGELVDFCGGHHNWEALLPVFPDKESDWNIAVSTDATNTWLIGAAILFRVKAIKEVGLLDEAFFAYYEDNDISVRLAAAGWKNSVAFNARFQHEIPSTRPPYYYYLMARNAFFFWLRYTPKEYRRFISIRLLERAIFSANKLVFDAAAKSKADACLLGGLDGMLGRGGQPKLNRKVPWFLILLRKALWFYHSRHIKKYY
ncbi:MAG: glycosyltransferase family 2 protein [Methylovulum sp.]|nr:glycosyltransferase family 2 protein [Methylovulum sp.]